MPTDILIAHHLPWPMDWAARFGRAAPLLVEVGFGGGHYLVDLAQSRPDANVIGVEISNPSLRRAQDRVEKRDLDNVVLVYGGAELFFWFLCAPETVSGVAINFPDPWPKPSHHRRRLVSDRFLALLASRMRPGAWLDIATDHADYQPWIAEHLARTPYFESRTGAPYQTRDDFRPRTKYERQALAAGVVCHYYKYARTPLPTTAPFPIPQELPMPNVIIDTPLTLADLRDRFIPGEAAHGIIRVRLLDVYLGVQGPALLVETYISEEPMSQRLGLVVQARDDGSLMLSLGEIGFPRVTPGVHVAMHHLASWIVSLDPASRIRHHNLAAAP